MTVKDKVHIGRPYNSASIESVSGKFQLLERNEINHDENRKNIY